MKKLKGVEPTKLQSTISLALELPFLLIICLRFMSNRKEWEKVDQKSTDFLKK